MKVSYNTLRKYIPNIKSVEEVAEDLIMHTAEVEEIIYEWENLKDVFIGEVLEMNKHPDSEKLNLCKVKVCGEEKQIVCWATNVETGQIVPIAVVGAKLSEDFVIAKTKIRGETSEGMICSEDELGLIEERQAGIMVLSSDAPIWKSMREYLWKNDCYLDIDNKAINHRPDLFSHIGIAREICAIAWEKFDFEFENNPLLTSPQGRGISDLWIKNEIPKNVKRYIWIKASWVHKVESPDYIKQVIASHWIDSKRLLVDVTNYSLYLYGQPTHIFDSDKIDGTITIRFAKQDEDFAGLDDKEYKLSSEDIVIADDSKVLALWWIIWGKSSAVSENTTSIIIESANFDQAIIRKTGKTLWIRTDALNVFEKDLLPEMCSRWASLIISELEKAFPDLKLEAISDSYDAKQKEVSIDYDLNFINNLIGKNYSSDDAEKIIENLGMEFSPLSVSPQGREVAQISVPFWRKDLNYKADIAEEIARIDGFDSIKTTPPSINMWAVAQSNTYKIKNETRAFFTSKGFFDMYNYSFVNESLMNRLEGNLDGLVPLKNALSEELTHMKWSLIPNLMKSLEDNIRETKDLQLFELEKVFSLNSNKITEHYEVSSVMTSNAEIPYYEIQTIVSDYLKTLWLDNFYFEPTDSLPSYAHSWRTAKILARGQEVGFVWEIHPEISKRFDIKSRVAFFSINIDTIKDMAFSITKATEISQFQMNNFDLNFVVDKSVKWKAIQTTIANTNKKLIKKVELFDIFESKEKLAWKRSLSFKIYIQSDEWTLDDKVKTTLIDEIVKKVEKKGWELR